MINDFFKNKKIFITGHTGFKGSWLSIWLHYLGSTITGFSDGYKNKNDNFVLSDLKNKITSLHGDINNKLEIEKAMISASPEIVFHLAAQPIVSGSYKDPYTTYLTNVIGTLNVLEAAQKCSTVKAIIVITTDKCYKNNEWCWGYRENDILGGYDPYSSSKACCEILVDSYRNSFFDTNKIGVATVRAGNVIGGGDWSADRIIPDCIRNLQNNKAIIIRNPNAIRPWQHVLEPLYGYMILAKKLYENPNKYSESYNFGPNNNNILDVLSIVNKLIYYYGKGSWVLDDNKNKFHEASTLSLDISKAKKNLAFYPKWDIDTTIEKTVYWYKNYYTHNVYDICIEQINEYSNINSV